MKRNILRLLLLLVLLPQWSLSQTINSFEGDAVPANFRTTTGTLSIEKQRVKLGNHSLKWNWIAGDTLIASPKGMREASIRAKGGIDVWIYNSKSVDKELEMWFYKFENSSFTDKCMLRVNLNFKGWRCVRARFRQDMFHPGYTLRSMKWVAPKTGAGTILIDLLEFPLNVSWERLSDYQYTVHNPSKLDDFLHTSTLQPNTLPLSVSPQESDAVNVIKERIDKWILGSKTLHDNPYSMARKKAFELFVQRAIDKIPALNLSRLSDETVIGNGLFPMDYYHQTINGKETTTFREISATYLIQLAYDAVKNGNALAEKTLLDIFDWYYDQGWAEGSGLGKLRFEMLRSGGFYLSAFLMRNRLSKRQYAQIIGAQKWYTLFGKIYTKPTHMGENSDEIRALMLPKLFTALLIKNRLEQAQALKSYVEYVENALSPAPGYLDCIKPDFSGYHHRGVYFNAYYPDALYIASLVCYFLHNTPYQLSEKTVSTLKSALLTFRFLSVNYNVPAGTTGRFPHQRKVLQELLPAFAYLLLSEETTDKEMLRTFQALWTPEKEPVKSMVQRVRNGITFKNTIGEMEMLVTLSKSPSLQKNLPVGNRYLPFAGLMTIRQKNWVANIKGFSKYIWDFESSATDNRYGRYLSYGQLELTNLTLKQHNFHPSDTDWDWSHLSGTTAKYLTKSNLINSTNDQRHRNFSDNPFLGGVTLDKNTAVWSNSIHDNTFDKSFYARKTLFQFDSILYCVGSGIRCNDFQHEVHTTLFQNKKKKHSDNIFMNHQSIDRSQDNVAASSLIDNYGTTYLFNDEIINIRFSKNLITAFINHGKAPTNAQYCYAMIPYTSKGTVSQLPKDITSIIETISHDNDAHIAYYKPTSRLSAVIFNPQRLIDAHQLFRVNIPCIIALHEKNDTLTLAFSDPDMHRPSAYNIGGLSNHDVQAPGNFSSIEIQLNGKYKHLSTSNSHAVLVKNLGEYTFIRYSQAKNGETYQVKLLKKEGADNIKTQVHSIAMEKTSRDTYQITTDNQSTFCVQVTDLKGCVFWEQDFFGTHALISFSGYPKGMYIVSIKTKNDFLKRKILYEH